MTTLVRRFKLLLVTIFETEEFNTDDNPTGADMVAGYEPLEQPQHQGCGTPCPSSLRETQPRASNSGHRNSSSTAIEGGLTGRGSNPTRGSTPELNRSVMRTVVSNGSDALNLLFEAATQDRGSHVQAESTRHNTLTIPTGNPTTTPGSAYLGANTGPAPLSPMSTEICKFWKSSKFVKMGWLSAQEIVTYLDL